jgi:hypothetical protein
LECPRKMPDSRAALKATHLGIRHPRSSSASPFVSFAFPEFGSFGVCQFRSSAVFAFSEFGSLGLSAVSDFGSLGPRQSRSSLFKVSRSRSRLLPSPDPPHRARRTPR